MDQQQQQAAVPAVPQGSYAASAHFPFPAQQYPYPPEAFSPQTAPPAAPSNPAPPPGQGFFNPWEPPPPAANPPSDPDLQKRIDKLVEYAAKNGPQFEALMKEKQKDNAAYAFLSGGEGQDYYRYKLWTAVNAQAAVAPSSVQPALGPSEAMFSQPYFDQPQQSQQQKQQQQQQQQIAPPQFFPAYPPQGLGGDQFGYTQPPFPVGTAVPFQGDLPPDVAAELATVLETLTGTKEVIKNAKAWFMQRSMYAQGLVQALKRRVQSLMVEPERQLHVVYLINDIMFNSLQHRTSPAELDHVALAFRPSMGIILATIFHGPNSTEPTQDRLRKILEFWGTKEVYDRDVVNQIEGEMMAGPPPNELAAPVPGPGVPGSGMFFPPGQWQQPPVQPVIPPPFFPAAQFPPPAAQTLFSSVPSQFPVSSGHPSLQEPPPPDQPPYPLFPPGLIPGMVRKMQIGSGVPYSPISPADIPTQIPAQTASETYILKRIKKFFKQIGEVDPLADENNVSSDDEDAKPGKVVGGGMGVGVGGGGGGGGGGARIGPPPVMEIDPETGTLPDGSVASSRGGLGGRAGLGANEPDENQYSDVYSSYRKSRSSNYHTALSARAAMKYEHA